MIQSSFIFIELMFIIIFHLLVQVGSEVTISRYCDVSACDVLNILKSEYQTSKFSIQNFLNLKDAEFRLRMLERRLHAMEQPGISAVSVWSITRQKDRWRKCKMGNCRCEQDSMAIICWSSSMEYLPASQLIPYDVELIDLGVNSLKTFNKDSFRGLVNLVELDIFDNKVDYLPRTIFDTLRSLKNLRLQRNKLEELSSQLLNGLVNLKMIDLSHNQLRLLPQFFFAHNHRLEFADFSYNNIQRLDENVFNGVKSLSFLDLSHNSIAVINNGSFLNTKSLKMIKLSDNNLTTIPENLFDDLENIEVVVLKKNRLKSLSIGTFKNTLSLMILDISSNKILERGIFSYVKKLKQLNLENNYLSSITEGLFANCTSLERLTLSGNKIEYLNMTAFQGMENLKVLILTSNKLFEVHHKVFSFLPNLTTLHLDNNLFPSLPSRLLDYLPSLSSVKLAGNPWNCDCHALYISAWLRLNEDKVWDFAPRCAAPFGVEGRILGDLTFPDLCTGQWASMVNLSPRLPIQQLLALNITVNRKPQQRSEDSY